MTKILTLGSFDLMHPGHVELFETCRRIVGPEGTVVVSVNESEFIDSFKGRPPVQTTQERVAMVKSVRYVDEVFTLDSQDAKPTILAVQPDFIIIGSDWAPPKDYLAQLSIDGFFLETNNIVLLFQHRSGRFSSTELKERIRDEA